MDNPAAPIPSTSPQPAIQPEVSSPVESQGRHWLLWLIGGLFLLIVGIALGIFSAKFLNQSPSPSQLPPTPTPTQSPSPPSDLYREPAGSAATTNWKTYINRNLGISFKYPVSWFLDEVGDSGSVRVQNYDLNTESLELANENRWLIFRRLTVNGVSPKITTAHELIDLLRREDAKECFYNYESSGTTVVKDDEENTINGTSVYSRFSKCSKSPDTAWIKEFFFIEGNGKTISALPSHEVSGNTDLIFQILSTFKFLD